MALTPFYTPYEWEGVAVACMNTSRLCLHCTCNGRSCAHRKFCGDLYPTCSHGPVATQVYSGAIPAGQQTTSIHLNAV